MSRRPARSIQRVNSQLRAAALVRIFWLHSARRSFISSPPVAAFRSRRLSRRTSNKGLNSNEALEESTATNSSVMLSGARREKEVPGFLDIQEHTTDSQNSDPGR